MTRYLLRRAGQSIVVILGVVILTFIIARLIPGDPAVAYAGPRASAAQLAAVRVQFGSNDSIPVQLWHYLTGIFRGDWGVSLHTKSPVLSDLGRVIPPTLELVIIALILAVILGVPAGILAARLRGKLPDALVRLGSILAVSMPIFWLALILQYVFFSKLHWLPVSGEYSPSLDYTHPLTEYTGSTVVDSLVTGNWAVLGSSLAHLVLPVLAVAAYPAGIIAMMIRASLLETISEEHVRTVRALGFGERAVFGRFAMKPSLNPVIAVVALVFAYSLANTFLVESVYNWPGLGRYATDSIRSLDSPAILGVALFVAIAYVVLNLVVDIVQYLIDPRIGLR